MIIIRNAGVKPIWTRLMMQTRRHSPFFAFPILILLSIVPWSIPREMCAGSSIDWRFFDDTDGLAESWSPFITRGSNGRVWVSHGMANKISSLFGLPDSLGNFVRTYISPGYALAVRESKSGRVWSICPEGLFVLEGENWERFEIAELRSYMPVSGARSSQLPFVPTENDRLYYALKNRVSCFDLASGKSVPVVESGQIGLGWFWNIISAESGVYWITTDSGAMRLEIEAGSELPEITLFPCGLPGIAGFDNPIHTNDDGLMATAYRVDGSGKVLVLLQGKDWKILDSGSGKLKMGWPGTDGDYWVWKDRNVLSHFQKGEETVQATEGILSGDFLDVLVESGEVFWIATSHGIARMSLPIWRSPIETVDIRDRIHVIHNDKENRLWFGARERLILLEDGHWKYFRLPQGVETAPFLTKSICSLPDGRLAIACIPFSNRLLVFDPHTEEFEFLQDVDSDDSLEFSDWYIENIATRRDGSIWLRDGGVRRM